LKEAHALTVSQIQQKLNNERTTLESDLRAQVDGKGKALDGQDRKVAGLEEKLYKLELSYKQSCET
jgi:hypothetical protein